MRKYSDKKRPASETQAGMALVSTIFAILLTSVIGFALFYATTISQTITTNERDNTEAFYIADAGINHAHALLEKVSASKYSNVLTAGTNTTPNSGDELSVPPVTGLWTTAEGIPAGNTTSGGVTNFGANGGGRYWVSIKNDTATGETVTSDSNGILIITSTGIGRNGATTKIEAAYGNRNYVRLPAILINGLANLSGLIITRGTGGKIHSNGVMTRSGTQCVEQNLTSSASTINNSGTLQGVSGGGSCSGTRTPLLSQPIIPVPQYNVRTEFFSRADYVMGVSGARAGKVYNNAGTQIGTSPWANGGSNWTLSGSTWFITGTYTPTSGIYYSEGSLNMSGTLGTAASPANATFISEVDMNISGDKHFTPKLDSFSIIAGNNLTMSGTTSSVTIGKTGIVYVRNQLNLSGDTKILGSLVIANNPTTTVLLTGNLTVTNNNDVALGSGQIGILSWREVRQ